MLKSLILLAALSTISLTPSQMAKIRKIEGRLMAPCCYTQTIRDHDSQVAEEMREEVTGLVASGKSEDEIITYYRQKYGETILVVPDGAAGRLTFGIPVTVFLLASCILVFAIRKSARAGVLAGATPQPPAAPAALEMALKRIRTETDGQL
jgi:cytochrome c-type biogenesis protein CcmH